MGISFVCGGDSNNMARICKIVLSTLLAFIMAGGAALLTLTLTMGTAFAVHSIGEQFDGTVKPIISADYSEIFLDGSTYIRTAKKEIPSSHWSREFYGKDMIPCDVEGNSKPANWFFTNYIYLSEDEMYAYMITDYDLSPSPYYQKSME